MGLEEFPGQTPEAALFNDVSNRDLVIEFLRSSLNPETTDLVAGRELTRRLHEHAGYKGKLATEPLTLPDGRPVLGEGGQPLMRIDYLNWALKDHLWAMGEMIGFLSTQPGTPEYAAGQAAFDGHAGGNQLQAGKG